MSLEDMNKALSALTGLPAIKMIQIAAELGRLSHGLNHGSSAAEERAAWLAQQAADILNLARVEYAVTREGDEQ